MAVRFYMDVHVPRAITDGLRRRGVDVLTAQENGCDKLQDSDLLDRATQLNRVLFSFDDDLLKIAASRQRSGLFFAGIVYVHQRHASVGACIRDLELIAKASEPSAWANRVEYLPL